MRSKTITLPSDTRPTLLCALQLARSVVLEQSRNAEQTGRKQLASTLLDHAGRLYDLEQEVKAHQ